MEPHGQQPEKVFSGKSAPWFIAIMALVAGGLSAGCLACFLFVLPTAVWPPSWLVLLLVPLIIALVALPVRSNRVELYADHLVIVYASAHTAIQYNHIRGGRRTRTLWAGTANSLDRVLIEASYDGDAIVSVRDNDSLVAELNRRCEI